MSVKYVARNTIEVQPGSIVRTYGPVSTIRSGFTQMPLFPTASPVISGLAATQLRLIGGRWVSLVKAE